MYPTYTGKDGRRYLYYVCGTSSRFGASGQSLSRVPAVAVEQAVVDQIRTVLTSPEAVSAVVRHARQDPALRRSRINEAQVAVALGRLSQIWEQLFAVERYRIAHLMIERVDLVDDGVQRGIRVHWRELGWDQLIGEFAPQEIGAELLEVEA